MSNFRKVFRDLLVDTPDKRRNRVKNYMELFGHTREEAVIIDDAVIQGIKDAAAAIGAALDTLSPTLALTAMPAILNLAAMNFAGLNQVVINSVFGPLATPDCDCASCQAIRALHAELTISEDAANAAAQPTRH